MATVYVAEFGSVGDTAQTPLQIAAAPPVAEQTIAIGGASVQSAAFSNDTQFVRVHTDAICSIAFGANPTATAAKMRLGIGQTEYFGVNRGDKIAVIVNV